LSTDILGVIAGLDPAIYVATAEFRGARRIRNCAG